MSKRLVIGSFVVAYALGLIAFTAANGHGLRGRRGGGGCGSGGGGAGYGYSYAPVMSYGGYSGGGCSGMMAGGYTGYGYGYGFGNQIGGYAWGGTFDEFGNPIVLNAFPSATTPATATAPAQPGARLPGATEASERPAERRYEPGTIWRADENGVLRRYSPQKKD